MGESAPDKVLHQLYVTLEVMKSSGDFLATEVQKKLRIIVRKTTGVANEECSFYPFPHFNHQRVLDELFVVFKLLRDSQFSFTKLLLHQQVAGGDGTASWLLGVVSDLKLPKPPPIATVPLGTGNNLPFSFGWVR